jgi:hypothetical protein
MKSLKVTASGMKINHRDNQQIEKCQRLLLPVMPEESQDERPFMVNRLSIMAREFEELPG